VLEEVVENTALWPANEPGSHHNNQENEQYDTVLPVTRFSLDLVNIHFHDIENADENEEGDYPGIPSLKGL